MRSRKFATGMPRSGSRSSRSSSIARASFRRTRSNVPALRMRFAARRTLPLLWIFMVAGTACGAGTALAAKAPPFKVASRIPLGGEGGWDYVAVDPDAQRLFVTHNLRVQVIDLSTDHVAGEIPDTPGPHGVAIAADLGRGFVSCGRDSSVAIFDSKTLAPIGRIKLNARNPDAIAYDPVSKRVFTFNGGTSNSTVIDAATGNIVGTINLNGTPEFAVADGQGRIYANLEDQSAMIAIDTGTMQVVSRWPLKPG